MLLHHISTYVQPFDDPSVMHISASTPDVEPPPFLSTLPAPPPTVADAPICASSLTTPEALLTQRHDPEPLRFPDDGDNHGLRINRTWVDTHDALLHTDPGLYICVRGIKEADERDDKQEGKRSRADSLHPVRLKVARPDLQTDAASASHTEDDSDDGATATFPVSGTTTAEVDGVLEEEGPEEETPKDANMDDRKPDISLIDLPHSGIVPPTYLSPQCAVFMEMKRYTKDGPLTDDPTNANAELPEDAHVNDGRKTYVCKSIVTQMADNARILLATRPFLRFCLHLTFCGKNFNLALFDRNGAIISRNYLFTKHFGLFIRIIRRLSCEMTAYDLGLDTTVRPEGFLGSIQHPSYLVKVSEEIWYRTEGVPLWQSTSLLGRGTLVFNARELDEPNGPLQVLKNAWREDGRLQESELYDLMQKSDGPLKSPKGLAKFIIGGDVRTDSGSAVTIEGHRARFGSTVIGNGATLHRLVLASHGKSLASYAPLKQLLKAAWAIVIGMKVLVSFLLFKLI
jgi:hypothetical protein